LSVKPKPIILAGNKIGVAEDIKNGVVDFVP
jgi:hypothetical protein